MVLEAPLASSWSNNFDVISMVVILAMWLVIQVWYIVRVYQFHRETARQMHLKTIAETIRVKESTSTSKLQTGQCAQLGSCTFSGRAWRLWLARHTPRRAQATRCPATGSGARANRLQSRSSHRLSPSRSTKLQQSVLKVTA